MPRCARIVGSSRRVERRGIERMQFGLGLEATGLVGGGVAQKAQECGLSIGFASGDELRATPPRQSGPRGLMSKGLMLMAASGPVILRCPNG
jgi:hypothetical protein